MSGSSPPSYLTVKWMLLCVGTWYNLRESVVAGVSVAELPRGAWDALLDPYRVDMGL